MADTIRETNIKAVLARLALITTANGYTTNIGAHVLRARKKIDDTELPCAVVWSGDESGEHKYGELACKMTLKIEGIVAFGNDDPSVIGEKIMGDIKKNLLDPAWTRSPDYIDALHYTGGAVETPDDGQITVGAAVSFELTHTEKLGDPASQ